MVVQLLEDGGFPELVRIGACCEAVQVGEVCEAVFCEVCGSSSVERFGADLDGQVRPWRRELEAIGREAAPRQDDVTVGDGPGARDGVQQLYLWQRAMRISESRFTFTWDPQSFVEFRLL